MGANTAVSFDGTEVWYSDTGGPEPVVVLLHGGTMTSISNFEVFYAPDAAGRFGPAEGPTIHGLLREAGARVIAIDTRGHGRSGRSPDPERYRGDAHALDVIAVLDDAGVVRADIVGYSLGSLTTMRLFTLDDRIRSAALCGTSLELVDGHDADMTPFLRSLGECFRSNSWDEHPEYKPYRAFARLDQEYDFASLAAALLGTEPVEKERLAAATFPVLVLNGGADDGDGDAAALAAAIPGARAVVAGTGNHGSACSDPEFQQALLEFVTAHW